MMKRFFCALALPLMLWMGSAQAGELLLGAGDLIRVSVYNNPDLTLETRVGDSGNISFPLIGAVAVAGMSTQMAEKKISSMLESGGFVKNPQVNIIVTVLQSQQVSVLGQVNRPGRFPIDGPRTVMDLLALAGGVAAEGADTINVIRKRDGVTTKDSIDLGEMMRTGDLKADVVLQANDVVYVERAPRFYIYGEVQRPGMFRLERSMTVLQALSAGGGLTPRGTERGIRIKRRDGTGKIQIIDAKQDDLVQIDDVVYIKESWF